MGPRIQMDIRYSERLSARSARKSLRSNATLARRLKFTAAVRNAESFQNDAAQPWLNIRTSVRKGGLEFFRYVDDGKMAHVGSVKDDTEKILGREPLLLREWPKLRANELLEIADS
jgi:hypothetical protein